MKAWRNHQVREDYRAAIIERISIAASGTQDTSPCGSLRPSDSQQPCNFTKIALDAAACSRDITVTTIVYAAWAPFLIQPPAQAIIGSVVGKAPFSTDLPLRKTVHG
ncbi:hypothetical protein N7462_002894 [Penicillium macrosclerotiorum]|uniref:uncharacterized protein n=1 Tax=Penicillium macrosclerotiorum TaxID=303699 RepID=UPI0025467963|nr:uncharacterized protein N7462_002894 [Penicillium macrosclerotiorum]KAJ5688502.1 hypothetical protein N7462_002894 [Penicillium macrosclerotiorum]